MLFSALGVGVGLGLGLASGQGLGKWANGSVSAEDGLTGEKIEQELVRQIVDGRESGVTFDEFPYFLRYHQHFLILCIKKDAFVCLYYSNHDASFDVAARKLGFY